MKKSALSLVAVGLAAVLAGIPAASLTDDAARLDALETWKADTESRLSALESRVMGSSDPTQGSSTPASSKGTGVLEVVVRNKRFSPSNARAGQYQDYLWWDAEYTAKGLGRTARSIKGILSFCDLFGDPKFQVRVTLNDPLSPGGIVNNTGVGIDYNQFNDSHVWLRSTELENMTFSFKAESVLYADGSTESFGG